MREFIVEKKDEGQTSVKYVGRILKDASIGFIYKMIRKKNIVLNGKKMDGSEKVNEGDVIKIFLSEETFSKFSGNKECDLSTLQYENAYKSLIAPGIIFEDEHVIIADKPVGMLSQKAKDNDFSINEWLIGYLLDKKEITNESLSFFMPSVCNRLDRNTGGIVLFGKTLLGANLLNNVLRERTIHKYYLTIVDGKISEPQRITSYLKKDEKSNKVEIYDSEKPDCSLIKTEYTPIEYLKHQDLTLLEVLLLTGKSHQIRAHLAHIGHYIIGDDKYGDTSKNQIYKRNFNLNNQLLYAVRIKFPTLSDYPALSNKSFEIQMPKIIDEIRKKDANLENQRP